MGDLTDKTLEWELADEKLSRLLVSPDLTESHSSGPVAMGLLHTASCRGGLAGSLGCQLLSRGLASGRFTRGLLGTGHGELGSSSLGRDENWKLNGPERKFSFLYDLRNCPGC